LLVGLLAVAGSFAYEALSGRIESTGDIERASGARPLAVLHGGKPGKMPADLQAADEYALLAARIEAAGIPFGTVLVTSSTGDKGQQAVALGLAAAFARVGRRVVLVNASFDRPQSQTDTGGLTAAFLADAQGSLTDWLVPTGIPNLWLLPAGEPPADPVAVWGSRRFAKLIARLKTGADIVIFDGPAMLEGAGAALLTRRCDANLLVVNPATTRAGQLAQARARLREAGARWVGTVVYRDRSDEGHRSVLQLTHLVDIKPKLRLGLREGRLRIPTYRLDPRAGGPGWRGKSW
jgi:Mrp family chromosome partitioning ATPase